MCYEKVLSGQTTVKRTTWVELQQNHLYLADYEIRCSNINPNVNLFFPLNKHKKLTTAFYASVFLLTINCVIALSKWLWNNEPQTSGSAVNVDNVMTKFIINKKTDVLEIDVNLFFCNKNTLKWSNAENK